MSERMVPSSGNVFEDLGFPPEEAANLRVRSRLMGHLREAIAREGLTQAQAARRFGVTQPRVSDLVCGRIERFSVDTLINMLGALGHRVEVVVEREAGAGAR